MYILKYYYLERRVNPVTGCGSWDPTRQQTPIYKQCSGMKLSKVMEAYRASGADHDLVKYTPRTIYDIINTAEA